jgi:hypothetical protein
VCNCTATASVSRPGPRLAVEAGTTISAKSGDWVMAIVSQLLAGPHPTRRPRRSFLGWRGPHPRRPRALTRSPRAVSNKNPPALRGRRVFARRFDVRTVTESPRRDHRPRHPLRAGAGRHPRRAHHHPARRHETKKYMETHGGPSNNPLPVARDTLFACSLRQKRLHVGRQVRERRSSPQPRPDMSCGHVFCSPVWGPAGAVRAMRPI